jgi:hypothetical protein
MRPILTMPWPAGAHGTLTRWLKACDCARCRKAQNDAARARGRARAQKQLPAELRQQLLDAVYAGKPFKTAIRDFGLTSNLVWGLTKTDDDWSEALGAALTPTRRHDLEHGTNAAYVHGCVCSECREHQRVRMASKPNRDHQARVLRRLLRGLATGTDRGRTNRRGRDKSEPPRLRPR